MTRADTTVSKPNVPDETIDAVEDYLVREATDRTVTSGELAEEFPELASSHDTNPKVRAVIKYLVMSGRVCVDGENYAGYRIPVTEDGRQEVIDSFRDDIGELNRRIQALKDARLAHEVDDSDTRPPDADEGDCEKCGGEILGDPWEWFSHDLCRECYDRKPPSSDEFHEWIETGQEGQQAVTDGGESR
jgi:hypothetical protein